jgi:AcrR family transcriptional regulator
MAQDIWQNRQRATSDSLKQHRRQDILVTAEALFDQNGYAAITMAQVAGALGLVKGTLYNYFATKEELFLAVQENQFALWFDAVDAALDELDTADARQIAHIIADTLAQRPSLMRLMAILHTVLEQNIEFESALRFKQMLRDRLGQTGLRLEKLLPYLGTHGGGRILLRIYALVIGLQQVADTSPVMTQVLARPDMAVLRVEFAAELIATIESLLNGERIKASNTDELR